MLYGVVFANYIDDVKNSYQRGLNVPKILSNCSNKALVDGNCTVDPCFAQIQLFKFPFQLQEMLHHDP